MAGEYPRRIDICPWGFWEHNVAGGTITRTQNNAYLSGGQISQGTVAQNDEIGWKVILGAGTWTFTMIHRTGTGRGIYTVKLDSASVGTIDGYEASTTTQVGEITGITVAASSVYTLKLVMETKNASSTNYVYAVNWIALKRTG